MKARFIFYEPIIRKLGKKGSNWSSSQTLHFFCAFSYPDVLTDGRHFYFGWDFEPSWGLVFSGGKDSNYTEHVSVEQTLDGTMSEQLPSLDAERDSHCLAVIDEDTLFVAGLNVYWRFYIVAISCKIGHF